MPSLPPAAGPCVGAILAAERIVKFGRKCGHSREQPHEPPRTALRLAAKRGYQLNRFTPGSSQA